MLSYIANIQTAQILQNICKRKNILILNEKTTEIDIKNYLKEPTINFNLMKYLFIDVSLLKNSKKEIVESIYEFSKQYKNIRIIIYAKGFNNQDILLTNLYDLGFYNIINENDNTLVETKINKIIETGLNKKDTRKHEKKREEKQKKSILKTVEKKIRSKILSENTKTENIPKEVYFFSLIIETIVKLLKFIFYLLIFILTSIGLTILVNKELRYMLLQILGLV